MHPHTTIITISGWRCFHRCASSSRVSWRLTFGESETGTKKRKRAVDSRHFASILGMPEVSPAIQMELRSSSGCDEKVRLQLQVHFSRLKKRPCPLATREGRKCSFYTLRSIGINLPQLNSNYFYRSKKCLEYSIWGCFWSLQSLDKFHSKI